MTLALTPTAIEVVRTITNSQGAPDGAGLRIASSPDSAEGTLQLSVAAAPADNDQVVGGQGARVFLDAQAATMLDDKVLDANLDDQGQPTFVLGEQGTSPT